MNITQLIALAMLVPAGANAWYEFGRRGYHDGVSFPRKRTTAASPVDHGKDLILQTEAERLLREFDEVLDGGMSLSYSLSIDYPTRQPHPASTRPPILTRPPAWSPTGPSGSPTSPGGSPPAHGGSPTSPNTPPGTTRPLVPVPSDPPSPDVPTSSTPFPGGQTSAPGSVVPTALGTPPPNTTTFVPSDNTTLPPSNTTTFFPSNENGTDPVDGDLTDDAVVCDGTNGISLGSASDLDSTPIFVAVGYRAESTSNTTDDFVDELELALLRTAVSAALGCDFGIQQRHLQESSFSTETLIVGPCDRTLNETESCTVMETELLFFLNGDVSQDEAAYAGYKAIEENMSTDYYVGIVPTVTRLEYLSPFPLPGPPNQASGDNVTGGDGGDTIVSNGAASQVDVSNWTIGASVATIMGGVISVMVWHRNRRSRQRRQLELTEDASLLESGSRNQASI